MLICFNHSPQVECKGIEFFCLISRKKWLWWQVSDKNFDYSNSDEFVLFIPASLGISTKFTWIVIIKFLALTYHHSHLLAVTCISQLFIQTILQTATPFLWLGYFWVAITSFSKLIWAVFLCCRRKKSRRIVRLYLVEIFKYSKANTLSHLFGNRHFISAAGRRNQGK